MGQMDTIMATGRANPAPCPIIRRNRRSVTGMHAIVATSVTMYQSNAVENQFTGGIQYTKQKTTGDHNMVAG